MKLGLGRCVDDSKDKWTGVWLTGSGIRLRRKVCMYICMHVCVYDLFIYFNKRITFERVLGGLCRMIPATLHNLVTLG